MAKHVPPSVTAKSFSCPVCGALADQHWYTLAARGVDGLPAVWDHAAVADFEFSMRGDPEKIETLQKWLPRLKRLTDGKPNIERSEKGDYVDFSILNILVSQCHSCKDITLWRHDTILYPPTRYEIEPNEDLPADVRSDFEEARTVLDISPRAAAALLRLSIQKLCKQLGQKGDNINEDIGALVKAGLPSKIQKALDLVRVVGNNAVHPGTLDLKDDRETAAKLFSLVNLIAQHMITEPNEIDALFKEKVPEGAKKAIAKRDGGTP